MAGKVNFKVYMTREDAIPEVRRFGIDLDTCGNFENLQEKLKTIFPSIGENSYTLSWKDFSGDNIVVSSDEELQAALSEIPKSQVKKFYLTQYTDSLQQAIEAPNSEVTFSHGVQCRDCGRRLYGYRYKCMQCLDHNLCINCEMHFLHPHHYMLRISGSMDLAKLNYARDLICNLNKLQETMFKDSDSPKKCSYKSTKCEQRSRQCGNISCTEEVSAAFVQDSNTANGSCPTKEFLQSQRSQQKDNETTKKSDSKSNSPQKSYIEFLKFIGKQFVQFLNSFGNDVEVLMRNEAAQYTSAGTSTPNTDNTSVIDPASSKTTEEDQLALKMAFEKLNAKSEGWTLLNKNDSSPSSNLSPISSCGSSVSSEIPLVKTE